MRSLNRHIRSVLSFLVLGLVLMGQAALAAPATPVINSPGNGSRFVDAQNVNVAFTFWRQRARNMTWRLYDNGAEFCSGNIGWDLTTNAVNRSCTTWLNVGTHTLTASVCSADGCSSSSISVTVVRSPVAPVFSSLDGNYPEGATVSPRMQFFIFGGEPLTWSLSEGGTVICSGPINSATDLQAIRSCSKVFQPGVHTLTATACHPTPSLCKSTTATFTVNRLGWTRFSGAAGALTRVEDLVTDPAGRSYATGLTTGALEGNPLTGVWDMFLHARDGNGNLIWAAQLGVPGSITLGYGIARNSTFEEIYVTGYTSGGLDGNAGVGTEDAFITKYRYTGVRQWTRQLGVPGRNTNATSATVDVAGNPIMVGLTNGALGSTTVVGRYDGFVAKYDPSGNLLWTRQFGAPGSFTAPRAVTADSAGNVYVTGSTEAGLHGNALIGYEDVFVIKYDAAGNRLWTRHVGAVGSGTLSYGITTDATDNVYLAGYTDGGIGGNPAQPSEIEAFVTRMDGAGNMAWTRQFGSGTRTWAWDILVDARGVFVTGGGYGDVTNPADTARVATHPYVAKLDTAGNLVRVLQQDTAKLDGVSKGIWAAAFGTDASGSFYLGGQAEGGYDGNTLRGTEDAFVTKVPSP